MMERLEARGRDGGERAAAVAAERLAVAARAALPGVAVEVAPEGVTISGRGLARRVLRDPALRWLGGLLK